MRIRSIWLILVGIIVVSSQHVVAATKYVDISYTLESPITLNEPVVIDVLIKSVVPYGITLDLGFKQIAAFRFRILRPDGQVMDPEKEEGVGGVQPIYLGPNEKYRKQIVLSNWFGFDIPGDYRIAVTAELPIIIGTTGLLVIGRGDESDHQTEEAEFTLTIQPHDEAALKKRCDALFQKYLYTNEYSAEAFQIIEQLTHTKDPIAIPYLAKLIKSQLYVVSAMNALMRIGTDEALEAIIPATQGRFDKDAAIMAKELLRQKVSDIRDPQIRRKVEDVVR